MRVRPIIKAFYAFLESFQTVKGKLQTAVIGRKNFLFSTSVKGAEANTIAYSIIETAKDNGLNVYKYLTYLFLNYIIKSDNW